MALQKNIKYKGLIIANAYCKIISLNGNKDSIFYSIGVFSSKDESQNTNNTIKTFSYSFVPSQEDEAPRWDKQAYENAKTQTDFMQSLDLLDE